VPADGKMTMSLSLDVDETTGAGVRGKPCLAGILSLLAFAGALGACSSAEETQSTKNVDAKGDVKWLDVSSKPDANGTKTDVPHDVTPTDTGVPADVEAEAGPDPGAFGAPCLANTDCNSSFCVDTPDGKQCTMTCVTDCPDGYVCKEVKTTGIDLSLICVPRFLHLCDPCATNKDCSNDGIDTSNLCVPFADLGSFCGGACSPSVPCPSGYVCADVTDPATGSPAKQCQPWDGQCTCSDAAKKLQLSTACAKFNLFGKCQGKRSCTPVGLSDCDARIPAPEECNLKDDDCNGKTDDFEGGVGNCMKKNTFGVCPGKLIACKDGVPECDAQEPGPEKCNGLDDNCNGMTDESTCDDGNLCTKDFCNTDGSCGHQVTNGYACDDGNPCTKSDKCANGQCLGGDVLDCDDANPCTTDACDPISGCTYSNNQAPCDDDGDLCTGDVCANGKCTHPPANSGSKCADDGEACTDDICQGGTCTHPPANGATCDDDGNPCTFDKCDNGACIHPPNNFGSCNDEGNPCTLDKCENGKCIHPPSTGNACNEDGNPCTQDTCQNGKCQHIPASGTSCDDGNACTVSDYCTGGKCYGGGPKDCAPPNECQQCYCQPGVGCVCQVINAACDDDDPCTTSSACGTNGCVGSGNVCKDNPSATCPSCVGKFTNLSTCLPLGDIPLCTCICPF